jgi:hypothetical protein
MEESIPCMSATTFLPGVFLQATNKNNVTKRSRKPFIKQVLVE